MNPQTLQLLSGVSSVLGFLSILAYFFTVTQGRRAERSVRDIVEGGQLFNPDQVLEILRLFHDDAARLEALTQLTNLDQGKARELLTKIKNNVDVQKLQSEANRHRIAVLALVGAVLLLLGVAGTVSVRVSRGGKMRATIGALDCSLPDVIRVRVTNHERQPISVAAGALNEIRRGKAIPAGTLHVDSDLESVQIPTGETRLVSLRARLGGALVDMPHSAGDDCRISVALQLVAAGRDVNTVIKECACPP